MSYRVPLATETLPGSIQIGSGLRVGANGVTSTGGSQVAASTQQITTVTDGLVIIDSMSLTPGAGTYRVFFNMN